jgi:hypothetical protein
VENGRDTVEDIFLDAAIWMKFACGASKRFDHSGIVLRLNVPAPGVWDEP